MSVPSTAPATAALVEPGERTISPLAPATVRHGFAERLKAAAIHLLLSAAIAAAVLVLVYGAWYKPPLAALSGVGTILVVLVAVDVVLGPLLTLVVFDRRKKSLPFDLACIALLQLAALAYGLYTVEAGRPHYLVFVKDRFEVVARADLDAADRARGSEAAATRLFGPAIVAAVAPDDAAERERIMLEAINGGRDLQHYPALYRPYAVGQKDGLARVQPLEALSKLNPDRLEALQAEIGAIVRNSGIDRSHVRYLPVRGPQADAAMLVDGRDGAILGLVAARPWQ